MIYVPMSGYLEWCRGTAYGENFLDLPSDIQKALEEYAELGGEQMTEGMHPDNLWVNSYSCCGHEEMLVTNLEMLDSEDYNRLLEEDGLDEWVEKNEDDIESAIQENGWHLLGLDDSEWYFLQ